MSQQQQQVMRVMRGSLTLVGLVVVAVGALVVVGSLASVGQDRARAATPASSSSSSSSSTRLVAPAAPAGRVGQRVESAGVALTVNAVRTVDAIDPLLHARPDRRYLVVDVTVENAGRGQATPYNPLYFRLRDQDGYEYGPAIDAPEPALRSGELAAGERVRGTVAFDLPSHAIEPPGSAPGSAPGRLVLAYQPLVLFGGYQTLRVALDGATAVAPE